jgi:hypothetical protein
LVNRTFKHYSQRYYSTDTGTQEVHKTSTQLAEILGTYVWVYSGNPEFPGDIEELYCKDADDAAFIMQHSITLSAAKLHPSQPVAPENITGHIAWGTLKTAFDGVRHMREGWSSDVAVSWMESYWEMLLTDDEDNDVWLDMNGNVVGAAAVLDDNGCPFLVFDWSHPPGCRSSWSGYYVVKRLAEGKEWQLTDVERGRLGIGSTFRSVAKLMKEGSPGVYEEDSEKDFSGDEYGSSDEEDVDVGEEKALSEDVGEKRKASDSETGTKKRCHA